METWRLMWSCMDGCNTMNAVLLTNVVLASCWINLKNYPAILLFFVWKGQRFSLFDTPMTFVLHFFQRSRVSFPLWIMLRKSHYFLHLHGLFGRWKISHTACEDHFNQWIKYRTNLCKKYCRGRISIWSLFCSSTDHDLLNLDKNAG